MRYGKWIFIVIGTVKETPVKTALTLRRASFLLSLIRPGADACLFIVDQPRWAGDHIELAVHTEVELAAH